MKNIRELPFKSIIAVDFEFEFGGNDGNRSRPVVMVAKDLLTGKTWRIWRDEAGAVPPFSIGPDTLIVAYYVSAELGCFRAWGWPMPARILDLCAEFKCRRSGKFTPLGKKLIGALGYFGLDTIGGNEKDKMYELILRGGPWSAKERRNITDYCESDVVALEHLLPAMLPAINLPYALLRGRYMAASSAMEYNGTPIDTVTLARLRRHWTGMQDELIADIDTDYGVFEGRTFKRDLFENYLIRTGIPWPRLPSGALDLERKTFREMAKSYSAIAPLHELRHTLSDMRLNSLTVGDDGRNRTVLWAFGSKTGRNQPGSTKYIFGPSVWLRGLIKPPPGHGVAYIDWSNQEFAIAAALSGDVMMIAAYNSGDPYLAFGKQSGRVPQDATKASHPSERELLKQCVLGLQYGMGERTLAARMNQPLIVARTLLRLHRETYRKFWKFADAAVAVAMQGGTLKTVFDWRTVAGDEPNPRSLMNFPMQANGAEMLRLACCLGTERGIEIVAPVHDAVLICAPLDRLDADIVTMRAAMAEASHIVLDGFEIRTDVNVVRYPDRYQDARGRVMWEKVMRLIDRRDAQEGSPGAG
jgi:DNA polymerase-1